MFVPSRGVFSVTGRIPSPALSQLPQRGTHTHTMDSCMHIHVSQNTTRHMHARMSCIHDIYIYMYIYIHIHSFLPSFIHAHAHAHTHTNIQTYTYI